MALHQHLEPRLDLGLVGADIQTQFAQRLALSIADGARRLGLLGLRAGAEFAKHIERVARRISAEFGAGMIAGAHLPGRAMSRDGVLLILEDRVIAHAGEVIVGVVVLADVLDAETPMLVLARPSFGRPMRCRVGTALPVAARPVWPRTAILTGFDANAIE